MLQNITFQRKCSRNHYKDKRLSLAEMRFGHLPLTTDRGDIYPLLWSKGAFQERCEEGNYLFLPESGTAACARLMGCFQPYSTYEVCPQELSPGAKVGFAVCWGERRLLAYVRLNGQNAEFFSELDGKAVSAGSCAYRPGMRFLFTFHAGVFVEMYCQEQDFIRHVGDVKWEECLCLRQERVFFAADAALYVESAARVSVHSADNYLDCGIMQADLKPVKYENGEVLVENGKIYLTFSARFETEMMQQIFSCRLSTCELELEGALLFDAGDGQWCGDVASSLIYDRMASKWRVWMCVFSHGHVLAYAETPNDPRFGINVMDVRPLPPVQDAQAFGGMKGDEDPDLYYDQDSATWYLSICRNDPEAKKYRYYLFRSAHPDRDFSFFARTEESLETTGGSFVRLGEHTCFAFGRSFSETSKYDCYGFPAFKKLGELQCSHPDGGFRGWGSVMEIPCGTRKRLLWVTFDRTRGSDYNWSYGNLYFFESETMR